jgi:hypothetical protein
MSDQWGMYICEAENVTALDVGDGQVVTLSFDMWFAWANGEDCTYDVMMDLYSSEGDYLGSSWHTTEFYYASDLDPAPPSLQSTYTNLAPVIDGVYSSGEWDLATVVDLMDADPYNGLAAVMRVANNATHLFVCFDVYGDQWEDAGDTSAISFDTGNDEVATDGAEDQFSIGPGILNEQMHAVYDDGTSDWVVDCTPFEPTWPDHEGLAGAYGFGPSDDYYWDDHRVYEYSIPLALMGITAGDEIGFVAASAESPGVMDGDNMYWSCWPKYFGDMPDMDLYATLVTAEPYPNTNITLDGDAGWNDWYLSNVTVTLEGFGGEGGFDYSMYSVDGSTWQVYDTPFEVSGDDVHTVDYYSVDVAGNSEPVHTADVWIDTHAPTMACDLDGTTGLDGWYTSDVTATLSSADATSGVGDAMFYLLDDMAWYEVYTDPIVVSGDGMHSIEYYTYDVAGNYFFSEALEFWIDTVGPASYAVYEADDGNNSWLVSAAEVNITASDDTSGVAEILYSIDGGDWETYTGNFTVAVDGIIDVEYTAVDVAGNQGAVTPFTLFIDTAPPTTTASVSGDYDVTLDAVDGTSGVDYTLYSVDGVTWVTYSGEFTAGSSGVVVVEYLSVDNAGNAEDSKTLYLGDSAPPVTEAVLDGTAGSNDWYVSDVEVTLDAEDDESEVAETLYSVDGGAWTTYDDPFDVTGDGDHLVEFYSTDVAGNVEDEQSVEFSIDTVGPTTTATVDGATVTFAATDATSGVAITSYRIDAGDWVVYTGAFEVTGEGNHTVEFSSTDAAGNDEAMQTVYVEVEGGGGISVLVLGAIVLVAVLVVVGLLLFMMMRKKKGPAAPAEAPPETQDMPPPPPQ